jgi:hypothetical protein
MMTQYQRTHAVNLILCGVLVPVVATSGIAFDPKLWAATPGRVLLSLAPGWLVGAFLCARGWSRLREEKKYRPDQTWLQFLQEDLAVAAVVIALTIGMLLTPPASRDALMNALLNALHDLETNLMAARGGHP